MRFPDWRLLLAGANSSEAEEGVVGLPPTPREGACVAIGFILNLAGAALVELLLPQLAATGFGAMAAAGIDDAAGVHTVISKALTMEIIQGTLRGLDLAVASRSARPSLLNLKAGPEAHLSARIAAEVGNVFKAADALNNLSPNNAVAAIVPPPPMRPMEQALAIADVVMPDVVAAPLEPAHDHEPYDVVSKVLAHIEAAWNRGVRLLVYLVAQHSWPGPVIAALFSWCRDCLQPASFKWLGKRCTS